MLSVFLPSLSRSLAVCAAATVLSASPNAASRRRYFMGFLQCCFFVPPSDNSWQVAHRRLADYFPLLRSFFFIRSSRLIFFAVACILRRFFRLRAVFDILVSSVSVVDKLLTAGQAPGQARVR